MFLVFYLRKMCSKSCCENGSSGQIRELKHTMCEPSGLWFGLMLFSGLSCSSSFWLDCVHFSTCVEKSYASPVFYYNSGWSEKSCLEFFVSPAEIVVLVCETWHALASSLSDDENSQVLDARSQKRISVLSHRMLSDNSNLIVKQMKMKLFMQTHHITWIVCSRLERMLQC